VRYYGTPGPTKACLLISGIVLIIRTAELGMSATACVKAGKEGRVHGNASKNKGWVAKEAYVREGPSREKQQGIDNGQTQGGLGHGTPYLRQDRVYQKLKYGIVPCEAATGGHDNGPKEDGASLVACVGISRADNGEIWVKVLKVSGVGEYVVFLVMRTETYFSK
jgi:hypothetical protein